MGMTMWGEHWYSWGEVEAHAAQRTAELRRALRDMTALLKAREWAEHVSGDADVTALEVEITTLVGRANAGLSAEFKEALRRFERTASRMGVLFDRYQGKGWPDKESAEFIELRDERMPAIRAEMRAALGLETPAVPIPYGVGEARSAEQLEDGFPRWDDQGRRITGGVGGNDGSR
jgi:C4-dicarboxylate-specific signal transduction histidine kinase